MSSDEVKMGILKSNGICSNQSGTDIIEHNLEYRIGEEHQCCDFCKAIPGCKAYTWNLYEGGICQLKHSDGPLEIAIGVKVGINDKGIMNINKITK